MNASRLSSLLPVVSLVIGCTSVTVRHVPREDALATPGMAALHGDSTPGLRYSLPKRYLVLHLAPDGTPTVTPRFVPDPECTYAIDSHSFFASHTFNATVSDEGLLKSVEWNPNATVVGAAAVGALAGVAKDIGTKIAAERAASVTSARGDLSTAQQASKAADATVKTKELALAQLKLELADLQSRDGQRAATDGDIADKRAALDRATAALAYENQHGDAQSKAAAEKAVFNATQDLNGAQTRNNDFTQQIREKNLAIQKAQTDLDAAKAAAAKARKDVEDARRAVGDAANSGPGFIINDVGAGNEGDSDAPPFAKAWGDVVYEIQEGWDPGSLGKEDSKRDLTVRLVPVVYPSGETQLAFDTTAPGEPAPSFTISLVGDSDAVLPSGRPDVLNARKGVVVAKSGVDAAEQTVKGAAETDKPAALAALKAAQADLSKSQVVYAHELDVAKMHPTIVRVTSSIELGPQSFEATLASPHDGAVKHKIWPSEYAGSATLVLVDAKTMDVELKDGIVADTYQLVIQLKAKLPGAADYPKQHVRFRVVAGPGLP